MAQTASTLLGIHYRKNEKKLPTSKTGPLAIEKRQYLQLSNMNGTSDAKIT
jgi:hypothetical protein